MNKKQIISTIVMLVLVAMISPVFAKERDLIGVEIASPTTNQIININNSFALTCAPVYSGNGGRPPITYTAELCDTSDCTNIVQDIAVGTPTSDIISFEDSAINPETVLDSIPWGYSIYGRNPGSTYIRCKIEGGNSCDSGCYSEVRQITVESGENMNPDDIIITSDFEMGNLTNIQHVEDPSLPYRSYTAELEYSTISFSNKHWWFNFSLDNATDKRIRLEITNALDADQDRFLDIMPVYSYTGNIGDWHRFDGSEYSYDTENDDFVIDFTPTNSPVYVAPIPPYTNTMLQDFLDSKSGSPFMEISTAATTTEGRDVKMLTITDPNYSDAEKFKVFILAGDMNSGEQQGIFGAQGSIDFLLDEIDPVADIIRKNYIFRIIPIQNVDGTHHGICRYTPFRNGEQYDLNRNWEPTELYKQPEVWEYTRDYITDWPADVFLSYHGAIMADTQYFIYPSPLDSNETALMDSIGMYWDETGYRHSGSSEGLNYSEIDREGILSLLLEFTPNQINPGGEIIDELYWIDQGKQIVLGVYDYLGVDDFDPPLVDVIEPLEMATVEGLVTIKADASDPGSGVEFVEYKIDEDGYTTMSIVGDLWEADWNTTQVENGLHAITVRAKDNENNYNTDVIQIMVDNQVTALDVNVSTDKSSYGTRETMRSTTIIKDSIGDEVENADMVVNIYKSNGAVAMTCTGQTDSIGSFSCNYKIKRNDPRGIYNIYSEATKTGYDIGYGEVTFEVIE